MYNVQDYIVLHNNKYIMYNVQDYIILHNNKYIMYNVQDYIVLHNKAVGSVICDGWHFTLMRKTPA